VRRAIRRGDLDLNEKVIEADRVLNVGKFDYVMANPPFSVDRVDKERLKKAPRFPLGLPTIDNANYPCIQIFYSALNATGRAGFVMANSPSDARGSELEVRRPRPSGRRWRTTSSAAAYTSPPSCSM
jgi:type I restriction-modification system DNA methylase subunit